MNIIIDYNNDKIIFEQKPVNISFNRIKDLIEIEEILKEIFNRLDYTQLKDQSKGFDIILSKYDEDNHITIGEW